MLLHLNRGYILGRYFVKVDLGTPYSLEMDLQEKFNRILTQYAYFISHLVYD